MLYQQKKSSVRNTQVGQAVNNSSIRKVGEMVKKLLFIEKQFKNYIQKKKKFKNNYFLYYIIIWKIKTIIYFLAKQKKGGCYVNNGKYGYFLTCQKKNYKFPEWLLPEEVTLDMAKRLIAYKQKYQKNGLKRKNETKNESEGMKLQKNQLLKVAINSEVSGSIL